MTDWQTIDSAPRDGTTVKIPLDIEWVRAFWSEEVDAWILPQRLIINTIINPKWWKPDD